MLRKASPSKSRQLRPELVATLIALCNNALSTIAKGQIASLGEASMEARECGRFADALLAEMADWSDELPGQRRRVVLALETNDRPAEWLYRYAAPADLATPLAIRAEQEGAASLPMGGPGTFPYQDGEILAFLHEQGGIYTNVERAALYYQSSTLEVGDLSPLMQRAFTLELAARIAPALAKDRALVKEVGQQAEIARQRAIADEENKARRVMPCYVSDAEYARHGIGI